MKHKVIGIFGFLMIIAGVGIIILQLVAAEKPVVRSIAMGSPYVGPGILLIVVSNVIRRKNASLATNNHST